MVYQVIGLMSGSSRDGLDIVFALIEEQRGKWSYTLEEAVCEPYPEFWQKALDMDLAMPFPAFLELHSAYGRYLGERVMAFIQERNLKHRVHFIASHGHTAYHNPGARTGFALGDGAQLAAITGLPVITDLRSMDLALGGQGAPIVPIGDRLLFSDYPFLLNIGGIANLTMRTDSGYLAGDIGPANQVFNRLAGRKGMDMDRGGELAAKGKLSPEILQRLADQEYYRLPMPKSLSNEKALALMDPLWESGLEVEDALATAQAHLVAQIVRSLESVHGREKGGRMLVTGGGAFNHQLMAQLSGALAPLSIEPVVPEKELVEFKEALVMALMGVLRWREETNIYGETTGASRDHVGGALWMGSGYQISDE